jgi:hypothetical protein
MTIINFNSQTQNITMLYLINKSILVVFWISGLGTLTKIVGNNINVSICSMYLIHMNTLNANHRTKAHCVACVCDQNTKQESLSLFMKKK